MDPNRSSDAQTTPDEPRSAASSGVSHGRRRTTSPGRRPVSKRLIDSQGPDPNQPPSDVKLVIGTIAGTHGVHGELKLKVLTDRPEHIPNLREIFLGERDTPVALLGARRHGDRYLIRIEGVTTPEEGKRLGGLKVRIRATDAAPLEPGEYFLYQLIGLDVVHENGDRLGAVSDLMETGANDVLVISEPGRPDLLVPNHPEFVLEIAPESNRIVVRPPIYPE